MRYFDNFEKEIKENVFYKLPESFNKNSSVEMLRYSVGPLLYIPAIEKEKLYKFFRGNIDGSGSVVMCLEDSIGQFGEDESIQNIREVLNYIREAEIMANELPLIFIRPKNINQMMKFLDVLKDNLDILCGIVIPKANAKVIENFIEVLDKQGCNSLYIMPIIETPEFTEIDKKQDAFISLKKVVCKNIDRILNIRIGITDILGFYRLRRSKSFTIYDNIVFRSFMSDLICHLSVFSDKEMIISGGVSEFYNMNDSEILSMYIKEIELDRMNGFIGKTVIHPKQLKVCMAMSVVSFEDYIDAVNIVENAHGKYGVSAGVYKNRMNEVNPHLNWAKKIIGLSKVYGVFKEGIGYNELLEF